MAAPSTPPLPASAGPVALPVIESPEGARVTIGGRHYDWFRGNSYLGLQAHPDVLRAACEATLRYGLKLRDHRRVGCHPCVLEWERAASLFFDCEAAVLLGSGYAGGAVMAAALGDDFDGRKVIARFMFGEFEDTCRREILQPLPEKSSPKRRSYLR